MIYLALAETVTLDGGSVVDGARVRELLSPTKSGYLNKWHTGHRAVRAYARSRISDIEFAEEHDEVAFSAIDQGMAMKFHLTEPRLAELACERLVEAGEADQATAVAQAVLARRTSDPAFEDLAESLLFTQNALYAQQPEAREAVTHPGRVRPEGHVNPRLYN